MDEEFFSSPRREEGANQDSQPTSNTGIGKKTRPRPSADWLNPPSFPQNQKAPSVRRAALKVDVAHSGESWEPAQSKITAAINQGILHGHKGVKIIHGYGASSGRARIRNEAILLLRSLASATSGRLSQDRHNQGAHILWLNR